LSKEGRAAGGLRLSDESMLASAGESVSMAVSGWCRRLGLAVVGALGRNGRNEITDADGH
jgi:hypothetical protein